MTKAGYRREVVKAGAGHTWPITPVPAPRQVRRDRFNPSPGVRRYREFRDECALRRIWHPIPGDLVVFIMPVPKSRIRQGIEGQPHIQTPDVDNLLKVLLDACYGDDAHIWTITAAKVWGRAGAIYIERREPAVCIPFEAP